jgi:hypothetical protein
MLTLAWRNLIHDKVRLGVTLTGIVFAVVCDRGGVRTIPWVYHDDVQSHRSVRR